MGLFQRVGDILSANLNDMVERFEEPEKMLKQAIREMESALAESLDTAAKVVASSKLIAQQIGDCERQIAQWDRTAGRSALAGDDLSARQAIVRKFELSRLLASLRDERDSACSNGQKLRRRVDGLQTKLAEARRKLATLAASRTSAQVCKRLTATRRLLHSDGAAFVRFERLRQRVDQAQAEADAFQEIADTWLAPSSAVDDAEFAAAIDAELAALKAKTATSDAS